MENTKFKFALALLLIISLIGISPALENYQAGTDVDLQISCDVINCSDTYNITIVNPNTTILFQNLPMTEQKGFVNYTINSTYSNPSGTWKVFLRSNSGDDNYEDTFDLTPNGELPTTPKAILYIGLLFTLLFVQAIVFWAHSRSETTIWRVWWFAITWMLMIGITFTAWRMSEDFFTSQTFLINFFNILFIVLVLFFMPFVLILLFWVFFMLFVWLWLILPMKDRGFTTEEAWQQVGDRNKGKAFGRLLKMADLFGEDR